VFNNGITQFYLPPKHPTPQPQSVTAWYSLHLPLKGWPGWVDLGGWSHTEVNVPHRELNQNTVTHPSTNRARRKGNFVAMDPGWVNFKKLYRLQNLLHDFDICICGPRQSRKKYLLKNIDLGMLYRSVDVSSLYLLSKSCRSKTNKF